MSAVALFYMAISPLLAKRYSANEYFAEREHPLTERIEQVSRGRLSTAHGEVS